MLGLLVFPWSLLVESIYRVMGMLFYCIGLLVQFPRSLSGVLVWGMVLLYCYIFGGMRSVHVAMFHPHWDETIVMNSELQHGRLRLFWEVTVLRNDDQQCLYNAGDPTTRVRLKANLWKENNQDREALQASAHHLPYKRNPSLGRFKGPAISGLYDPLEQRLDHLGSGMA